MVKKFKCGQCPKYFANEWGLRVHVGKKHAVGPPKRARAAKQIPQVEIRYCPVCGFNIGGLIHATSK